MKPNVARSGDQKHQIEDKYRSKPGVPETPAEYQRPLLGVPFEEERTIQRRKDRGEPRYGNNGTKSIQCIKGSPRLFSKGSIFIEVNDNDTTVLNLDTGSVRQGKRIEFGQSENAKSHPRDRNLHNDPVIVPQR